MATDFKHIPVLKDTGETNKDVLDAWEATESE
jgi:hypothetical protein